MTMTYLQKALAPDKEMKKLISVSINILGELQWSGERTKKKDYK